MLEFLCENTVYIYLIQFLISFYNIIFIFITLVNSDSQKETTRAARRTGPGGRLRKLSPANHREIKLNPLSFGVTCPGRLSRPDIPASIANKSNKSFCLIQLRKPRVQRVCRKPRPSGTLVGF